MPRFAGFVVLALVVAGGAWLGLRDRGGSEHVRPLDGDAPEASAPRGRDAPAIPTPAQVTSVPPAFPREAIGDGEDIPTAPPRTSLETRTLTGVGADGMVPGRRLRDAIVGFTGVVIRYRTEAIRAAFLDGSFRVPVLAYQPNESPQGAPILEFVDVVRQAGFDVVFRDPVVVIGMRSEPGQAPPPPPRPEGSPDGPR